MPIKTFRLSSARGGRLFKTKCGIISVPPLAGVAAIASALGLSSPPAQAACVGTTTVVCTGTTTYTVTPNSPYIAPATLNSYTIDPGATVNFQGYTGANWDRAGWYAGTSSNVLLTVNGAANTNWDIQNLGSGATVVGSTGSIIGLGNNGSVVSVYGNLTVDGSIRAADLGGTLVNSYGTGTAMVVRGTLSGKQTALFLRGNGQVMTIDGALVESRSAQIQQFGNSNVTVLIQDSVLRQTFAEAAREQASIRIIGDSASAGNSNAYTLTRSSITTTDNGIAIDNWTGLPTAASGNTFVLTDSTISAGFASIVVDGGTNNSVTLNGSTSLTSSNAPTVVVNSAGPYGLLAEGGYRGGATETFDLLMNDASSLNGGLGGMVFVGGIGIQRLTLSGQSAANGSLAFGADADRFVIQDSASAGAIDMGAGNDTAVWVGASTVASFQGGTGSDQLAVSSSGYDGSQALDGGDDTLVSDTFVDALTLSGLAVTANGASIRNWEVANLSGTALTISDGAWTVGDATDLTTGAFLANTSTLNGMGGLALTGNLAIDSSSQFVGTGGGAGVYSISGALANNGTVTTRDNTVGDVVSVGGDYSGTGRLLVDVDVDTVTADTLIITGDVTGGTTLIDVNNLGAVGSYTGTGVGAGIAIVDVSATGNTTAGDFALLGGILQVGAFNYNLNLEADGVWYLQSAFLPQVPTYEVYGQHLLGMTKLPTMQQRIGNRWYWPEEVAQGSGPGESENPYQRTAEGPGIWTRIEGSHASVDPSTSSGATFDQNRLSVQAGADGLLKEWDDGSRLFVGLTAHYNSASTDVSGASGNGSIETNGYGVGGTATWLGANGAYVDLQGAATWFDSDLSSAATGTLINGSDGFGYAFSAEIGRKLDWRQDWTITPQAQLVYARAGFDDFSGALGEAVSLSEGDSLSLRMGVALDRNITWTGDNGELQGSHVYGIANLIHVFDAATITNVAGAEFNGEVAGWMGEVGLGMSRNFNDDQYSVYGEVNAATALDNPSDNYRIGGTIGLRAKF